jgi:exodeoxyribonuclease VII small subunit
MAHISARRSCSRELAGRLIMAAAAASEAGAETGFISLLVIASASTTISQPYRCVMPAKKSPKDFEESLASLEALVNKMEQGDMSLEESLKAFETGIQLTRDCQARLAAAEQQVQQLVEQQGKLSLQPLDSQDLENGN